MDTTTDASITDFNATAVAEDDQFCTCMTRWEHSFFECRPLVLRVVGILAFVLTSGVIGTRKFPRGHKWNSAVESNGEYWKRRKAALGIKVNIYSIGRPKPFGKLLQARSSEFMLLPGCTHTIPRKMTQECSEWLFFNPSVFSSDIYNGFITGHYRSGKKLEVVLISIT